MKEIFDNKKSPMEDYSAALEWIKDGRKRIEDINKRIEEIRKFVKNEEVKLNLLLDDPEENREQIEAQKDIVDKMYNKIIKLEIDKENILDEISLYEELHDKFTEELKNLKPEIEN